ncbi:MAG: extracellular solute-binding protein [Chitinophagales bacterium]|nr:extracellular solute-binding protein [Chitinophagales bacterium]
MKRKTFLILIILFPVALLNMNFSSRENLNKNFTSQKDISGKISLSGAYALYPMAVKWAEEFQKLHPGVKIDVQGGGAGKGMTDVLSGTVSLGMVSRDISPEEIKKGAYGVGVCEDAVIPTINTNNPFLATIKQKGITKQQFYKIFVSEEITTWGQLLGVKSTKPIKLFTRSDASGAGESWAKYLGYKQEDLVGTGVFGDPGLAQAVSKDPYAMGFNNINFVYDNRTRQPQPGLFPCPMDWNGNGAIDANENVFGSLDKVDDAIQNYSFPHPPARLLYLVSKGKPNNALVLTFLNWILTDGQKYCDEAGFVKLQENIRKQQLGLVSK